jgi:osmotically-inducible protein OsmY
LSNEFALPQSKEFRMFTSKYFRTIGVTALMSATLIGCATSKPDEKITANVRAAIDRHPDLGPPGAIQVQTHDGVVYLSGLVDSSFSVENAVSVARRVKGVTGVVNNVSVDQ